MATTTNQKNIPTATAWYLTPDSDKIQKIQLPVDFNDYEIVRPLLHCDLVGYQGFTNNLGKEYGVLMDEEGLFKAVKRDNNCARKLFRKIPLRWGTFTNYFIVYSYDSVGEGRTNVRDMDLTPQEFVKQYTDVVNSR